MTIRAQVKFDAGDVRVRTQSLLSKLRVIKRSTTADPAKLQEFIDEYIMLVERLGTPMYCGCSLDPRETATFQRLQYIFDKIELDIKSAFAAQVGLSSMVVRSFNRSQSILLGSEAELRNAAAESLTAAIQGGLQQRGTFIAIDSFDDLTKTNLDRTDAEVSVIGGALTLAKSEVFPIDHSSTRITVDADTSIPTQRQSVMAAIANSASNATVLAEPDFLQPYEGKFYALLGLGEFEAGILKLIETDAGKVPAPTDPEKLANARTTIVDGAADSYHQVERVVLGQEDELDPSRLDSQFPYDFSVNYVFDIGTLITATAFVLDPLNFGDRSWLEIVTLETSKEGDIWEEIPGLHDHTQYNILTDEANKVLDTNKTNTVMAPSKYQYGGQGLWVFEARDFRYIRATILQRTPVAQPYEVIQVKQNRQVTRSRKAYKIGPFQFGKDTNKTTTEHRTINLSYADSLDMFNGREVLATEFGSYRATGGTEIDIWFIGNIFSGGGTSVDKSAWTTSDSKSIVKENAVRYAIGIREFEVLSAKYHQNSTYISKPFKIAAPIRQLTIRVDDRESTGSIKYSVSIDAGSTWARIAPIDNPTQYEAGSRIPTVVQINSLTPEDAKDDKFGYLDISNPATEVLVRIELGRPVDNDGVTPIVKRYALEILTSETKGLDV